MGASLEIPDLFLVLNMIYNYDFSCSTLEINLVFPRTHVLFSVYYTKLILYVCVSVYLYCLTYIA